MLSGTDPVPDAPEMTRKKDISAIATGFTGDKIHPPACGPDEIHVWLVCFESCPLDIASLRNLLSNDERERADRYIQEDAQRCFIAARGILRRILAGYLGTDPAGLVFTYNEHGRPAIASPAKRLGIVFNLSHSGDMALYAVSGGPPVGVDLERMRPMDFMGIATRFFTPAEAAVLATLPEAERTAAFFECWTRKEAFAKAQGTGLHLDLRQVEVSLGPGVPPHILHIRGDEADTGNWSLHDIDAGRGFKAALAVRSRSARVIRQPATVLFNA